MLRHDFRVMLRELDEFGFTDITGVDYSNSSVQLARQICQNLDSVTVDRADILDLDMKFCDRFEVAIDKGTLDAISLTPEDQRQAIATYAANVAKLLKSKEKTYLLITSCNWTIDELTNHLASDFNFIKALPVPTFTFGGKSGSTTSTALFCKKITI